VICRILFSSSDDVDEQNVLTRIKDIEKLGRDVHARMKELMYYIKTIQIDMGLLERNDGIISLESLSSHGAVDACYLLSFRDQDNKEV
jgi:hypothetical protein